jgi:CBS domain-containing protein
MADHDISGVPVVEKGTVLGVVSESDIIAKERGPASPTRRMSRWFARKPVTADIDRLEARTAGEAMTSPAISIQSWCTTAEAAALMLEARVHRLPVLKGDRLVGIVTRADLVGAFARSDEEIALDIREEVLLRSFWITPGEVDVIVRNGEVTLTGTVESELLTELLPEAVQRVPGVVRVRSKLGARAGSEARLYEPLVPRF